MAAAKPEVHTAAVVCEIESKFQIYFWGFQGYPTQWKCFRQCHMTADAIFTIWRPTNRRHVLLHTVYDITDD